MEVTTLHDHILRVKDSEEVPFVLVGNKVLSKLLLTIVVMLMMEFAYSVTWRKSVKCPHTKEQS